MCNTESTEHDASLVKLTRKSYKLQSQPTSQLAAQGSSHSHIQEQGCRLYPMACSDGMGPFYRLFSI
jgi:hypothetical protein